jgi:lipopolysaccharide export system permease protein
MTIFSRYVFRQTSSALLLVLLSLTGIVWISLALRELNVVTSGGQSALTLIKMTTLGLPGFVAVITPFALLITVIHTLNRLNSDSEIIVLTASGATAWTIVKPLVALAVAVMLFISFVNHLASPWSLRLLRDTILQIRTDLLTQVIQPGRFSSPEKGLTFHIRERALDGTLYGLVMHDERKEDEVQTYLADKGVLIEDKGQTYLFMTDGNILRRSGKLGDPTQIIEFDKYAIDLDQLQEKTDDDSFELKPRERYLSELVDSEPSSPPASPAAAKAKRAKDADPGRLTAEIHERFSNALYPLAFTLMAIAVVGQAQSTRQNRNLRMGMCFLAGVAIRLSGLATNNIVVVHPGAAPVMYAIPLVAIAISLVLIVRGARPARRWPLLERITDAITGFGESVADRMLRRGRKPALVRGR